MEKIVFEYMEQFNMIEPGNLVIAGVSGGADSMCLLGMLLKYRKRKEFELVVVHVNHGIRGGEAYRDEAHVRDFCAARAIPFEAVRCDVPKLSADWKLSLEEAGRKARREAFLTVAEKYRHAGQEFKIAVAHQKGDLAETVLFHLVRGSGIRGAAGIFPVNGPFIRPLLCCDKKEMKQWLSQEEISYVEDSTNLENEYSRNCVRNLVIPCIEENINSGAVENLCNFAEIMRETWECLDGLAQTGQRQNVRQYGQVAWLLEDFFAMEPILQAMAVRDLLAKLSGDAADIEAVHIRQVRELFSRAAGTQICLSKALAAKRGYAGVYLFAKGADIYAVPEIRARELGNLPLDCEERIRHEIIPREKNTKFPIKTYTKYFDCDKIKGNLCVRKKMPGDYLILSENGGRKSLKSYLIDQKVPRELRERLTVVAEGDHVLWVVGLRDSAGRRIDENTRRVLKVWLEEDTNGEGAENGEEPRG